jgi:hypothetical protein
MVRFWTWAEITFRSLPFLSTEIQPIASFDVFHVFSLSQPDLLNFYRIWLSYPTILEHSAVSAKLCRTRCSSVEHRGRFEETRPSEEQLVDFYHVKAETSQYRQNE